MLVGHIANIVTWGSVNVGVTGSRVDTSVVIGKVAANNEGTNVFASSRGSEDDAELSCTSVVTTPVSGLTTVEVNVERRSSKKDDSSEFDVSRVDSCVVFE